MTLTLTDTARRKLAIDGYEPTYGARPLKRLLRREVENPLAKCMLRGEFVPGDTIIVDVSGESFTFDLQTPARTG